MDYKEILLNQAKEELKKKQEIAIKNAKERIKEDSEKINKIIELISKELIYKRKKNEYILVTKKVLFEDYNQEVKYNWQKKLVYKKQNGQLEIYVNAERYYHIGSLLQKYEKELKNKIDLGYHYTEKLRKIEKEYQELKNQQPMIIKLIKNLEKYENLEEEEEMYD